MMNENFQNENTIDEILLTSHYLSHFTDKVNNAKIKNISLIYKNNLKLFISFEPDSKTLC